VPLFKLKFADGCLPSLQSNLLRDLARESFAVLLGRRSALDPTVIRIIGVRYPNDDGISSSGIGHVSPSKSYIYDVLKEISQRLDVDALIDVHTHPFSIAEARFSSIDDQDEKSFRSFLDEHYPDLAYGSIVFSQTDYEARLWVTHGRRLEAVPSLVLAQRPVEQIPRAGGVFESFPSATELELYDRVSRVIGVPALRAIMQDQRILIVGLGGLGSLIAENLVQMGFTSFILVDPDRVELSNISRLGGATYRDALRQTKKVRVAKRRIRNLNPTAKVSALAYSVEDERVTKIASSASWIIVCTDNHASRLHAQRLSHDLFIPLISVGVNITSSNGVITDESGEVLTCVNGSGVCLICSGRVNLTKVAQESHPLPSIREEILARGYVSGALVTEPAVKTLNAILAAMATDMLVDQYTGRRPSEILRVYENNLSPKIYSDLDTIPAGEGCFSCAISEPFGTPYVSSMIHN